jgi:hypothetical protein
MSSAPVAPHLREEHAVKTIRILAAALVLLPSLGAAAQTGPRGWKAHHEGNEILMHPADLADGETYVLGVEANIESGGKSLRDWLTATIATEGAKLGKQVQGDQIAARPNGALVTTRVFETRTGKSLQVVFAASQQPNGRFLLFVIVCSPDACRAHNPAAVEWMKSPEAKKIGQAATQPPAAPERRNRRARQKPRPAYQTEPGQGLKPSEIEDVVVVLGEARRPVLLLKNGEYTDELDVPPEDMNVAAHKKEHPRDWGTWRRRRGKIELIDWSGKPSPLKVGPSLVPGRAGEELSGTFAKGAGRGNMSSLKEIGFQPGGRFAIRRTVSVAIAVPGVGGARIHRGSYRIEGRTIEFRNDDGTVDREAFHWVSEKRDAAFFNDDYYSLDD